VPPSLFLVAVCRAVFLESLLPDASVDEPVVPCAEADSDPEVAPLFVRAPPAPEFPGPLLAEYVVMPDLLRLAPDAAGLDAITLQLASMSTPVRVWPDAAPFVAGWPSDPVWPAL
jgi:hypothetical protein